MRPPEVKEFLEALVAPTFEGIFATLLYLYARRQGKVRAGVQAPEQYPYLTEILGRFPRSPVVFYLRDPRDRAFFSHEKFGTSFKTSASSWNEAVRIYRNASRAVHLVRYEDLVQKPEETIRAVCTFLGEAYEPQMLRFHERVPSFLAASPDLWGPREPLTSRYLGVFRRMPSDQIEWIESACAAGMQAMGYPLTIPDPKALKIAVPSRSDILFDRVRYYGMDRRRWRRGWTRWKIGLRARLRYWLWLEWERRFNFGPGA